MAATAENSQNVLDALAAARDHLYEAKKLLNVACDHARQDYDGNAAGIKDLPASVQVVLNSVNNTVYVWDGWNQSRQRRDS